MEWSLTFIVLALLGVATISKRVAGTAITPAILFVSIGLLVGPRVLDAVDVSSTSGTVRALAEATLAFVLFSDASRIDFAKLRRDISVPVRLLGVGLPLTILAGALVAALLLDQLTLGEAVIVAVVLAPTDAALGQAVVTDRAGPGPDPPGTERRERAQRRDLRAAALRRRRSGRCRIAHRRGAKRGHAAA